MEPALNIKYSTYCSGNHNKKGNIIFVNKPGGNQLVYCSTYLIKMLRQFLSVITKFSSDKEELTKLDQTLSSNYRFIDKGCPLNALPVTTSSRATTGATSSADNSHPPYSNKFDFQIPKIIV